MLGRILRHYLVLSAFFFAIAVGQGWQTLADQSDSLRNAGGIDSAIVLMELALTKHGSEWTQTDTAFATSLCDLADAALNSGKPRKALSIVSTGISIREQHSYPLDPMLAQALKIKGVCCWALGECARARVLFEQALGILEKSPEPDSLSLLRVLINYAAVSNDQHRFSTAMKYFQRALAICDSRPDLAHLYLGIVNNNLSNVYLSVGRFSEAAESFQKELSVLESDPSPDTSILATCLQNLAEAYSGLQRYPEAAALLHRALEIEVAYRGEKSPDVAVVLSEQADLDLHFGNYDQVRSLCEKTLAIQESTYGLNHRDVAGSLSLYAKYWCSIGNYQQALRSGKRAFDITRDNFVSNCWVMTEIEALRNSEIMRVRGNKYLSYFRLSGIRDAKSLEQAADIIFASKGEVSDEIFLRNRGLIRENDRETREIAEKLWKNKRSLSYLHNGSKPAQSEIPLLKAQMDSLGRVCDKLESELAARSLSYREATNSRKVGSARIGKQLPENSALIEYLEYRFVPLHDEKSQSRYLGVLLTGKGPSMITDLGACSPIDSLINQYRDDMTSAADKWPDLDQRLIEESDSTLRKLYRALWKPFAEKLATIKTIYIAPDGALNLVSFACLKNENGRYLIEEHPIHYLSAGRDLLRLQRQREFGGGLLALGDPDFYAGSSAADSEEMTELSPLPYTRREINDVVAAWQLRREEPHTLLIGADAREGRFKQEAPGKKVLHLATHGFFQRSNAAPSADSQDYLDDAPSLQNPLLNSGLYLSGAGARSQPKDGLVADDGILTAYEVADLDLTSVDWVVLSACESGLGDIKAGEGVYGLRRAFLLAGARTVISALWQVDDHETAKVMKQLYLSRGSNLAVTMRALALNQIAEKRSKGLPDHPCLWGAFIAVGDWRVAE